MFCSPVLGESISMLTWTKAERARKVAGKVTERGHYSFCWDCWDFCWVAMIYQGVCRMSKVIQFIILVQSACGYWEKGWEKKVCNGLCGKKIWESSKWIERRWMKKESLCRYNFCKYQLRLREEFVILFRVKTLIAKYMVMVIDTTYNYRNWPFKRNFYKWSSFL